jgi:hypothetical protein
MNQRTDMRREQGQAMVEFAVVLPMLLLLLFAIIQLGIVFNHYLALTDAVRAGSRVAAVSRFETCPSCKAETAVRDAAPALDDELDVDVESSWLPGEQVTVTGAYPYEINILGKVVASGWLTSEVKERVE